MEESQDERMSELLASLKNSIPPDLIKTRMQGGSELAYIEWTTALDIIDTYMPSASIEITNVGEAGEHIFVTVRITYNGVTKENIGCEKLPCKGYGDPFTNAYAQAIKRAAVGFGIGRELYQGENVAAITESFARSRDEIVKEALELQLQLPIDRKSTFNKYMQDKFGSTDMKLLKNEDLQTIILNLRKALNATR